MFKNDEKVLAVLGNVIIIPSVRWYLAEELTAFYLWELAARTIEVPQPP